MKFFRSTQNVKHKNKYKYYIEGKQAVRSAKSGEQTSFKWSEQCKWWLAVGVKGNCRKSRYSISNRYTTSSQLSTKVQKQCLAARKHYFTCAVLMLLLLLLLPSMYSALPSLLLPVLLFYGRTHYYNNDFHPLLKDLLFSTNILPPPHLILLVLSTRSWLYVPAKRRHFVRRQHPLPVCSYSSFVRNAAHQHHHSAFTSVVAIGHLNPFAVHKSSLWFN